MMRSQLALLGCPGDWTNVFPTAGSEFHRRKMTDKIIKKLTDLKIEDSQQSKIICVIQELKSYLVLDDVEGTLSSLDKGNLLGDWEKGDLASGFGRDARFDYHLSLMIIEEFFVRNCFCRLKGEDGDIIVIHISTWKKALCHWILRELLIGFIRAPAYGLFLDELSDDQLKEIKSGNAEESTREFGRRSCAFLFLGVFLAFSGRSEENLPRIRKFVESLKTGSAEGFNELQLFLSSKLSNANEDVLHLAKMIRYGNEAWLESLICQKSSRAFEPSFREGGRKNLGILISDSEVSFPPPSSLPPIYRSLDDWIGIIKDHRHLIFEDSDDSEDDRLDDIH